MPDARPAGNCAVPAGGGAATRPRSFSPGSPRRPAWPSAVTRPSRACPSTWPICLVSSSGRQGRACSCATALKSISNRASRRPQFDPGGIYRAEHDIPDYVSGGKRAHSPRTRSADVVRRPRAVAPGAAARPRSVHDSEPPKSSSSRAAMPTAPPPQAAPPITGIAHWPMQARCTPAKAPTALASTSPPALPVMAWMADARAIAAGRSSLPGPSPAHPHHLPPVPVELLLPNAGDQPREPQPLRTAGCEPALTSRHRRAARRAAAPAAQSEVAAAHG
jgi:hypothetical protein